MKKPLAATLMLLISASIVVSNQTAGEWIKYTSAEGRYSVLLPAQPKLSSQEAVAGTGEKFPQYLASVFEPGDIGYMTGYFDHLPGTIFSLDGARDGMLERVKGTLLSENGISLSGYAGREMKVSAKLAEGTEYIIRSRIYDTDSRVYMLQFIVPKSMDGDAMTEKAAKYFDSFQLVKK